MKIRLNWFWMIPILLVSTILVTGQFTKDTIWYDEVTTMLFIGGGKFDPIPIQRMFFAVAVDNAWPPGYFLIAYVWEFIINGSLLGHRLIGFWGGLLAISAMYRLGKTMFTSERAGLIAALLIAVCAGFLHQFHEARGYTLWIFASIAQLWFYWKSLTPRNYAQHKYIRRGLALSTAAVLYTHYVAVVSVFLIGLYHLIFQRKNAKYVPILKQGINGCLLYTPWIAVLAIGYYNKTLTDTGQLLGTYWSSTFAFSNGMPLLLVVIFAYTVWKIRAHPALKMLLFWVIGIYAIVAIGNYWANFVHNARHIMVVLIPIVLLLTYLINDIWEKLPYVALTIPLIWVAMGAMNSGDIDFIENMTGQYALLPADTMDTTVDIALRCIPEDDKVVLGFWPHEPDSWVHNMTMFYHLRKGGFEYVVLDRFEPIDRLAPPKIDNVPYEDRIAPFIDGANRVWLFMVTDSNFQREQEILEDTIADMGYSERDLITASPDLTGYIYYTADDSVDAVHQCVAG